MSEGEAFTALAANMTVGVTEIVIEPRLHSVPAGFADGGAVRSRLYVLCKRLVDVLLGTALAMLAIPVILVLALVLAIQLRGWPFFVHDRVGKDARTFRMPKLRTLPRSTPTDADKTQHELTPISRLAGWMRRSHLDELPQLLLVPMGRLSLVGPRPRMPREIAEQGDPEADRRRVSVPQGCTGLWQVSSAQHQTVSNDLSYDLWYVANRSGRLDAWILWRTLRQIAGGRPRDWADIPPTLRRSVRSTEIATR